MADYILRANNAAVRGDCPICGISFKPDIGLWPFVPGSWTPLCPDCATGRDRTNAKARAALMVELQESLGSSGNRPHSDLTRTS